MSSLQHLNIDKSWTLFLDRDGVINRRIVGGYVQSVEEFEILPGVLEVWPNLSKLFDRIVIVTNQQGIGKGLMTETDLNQVHSHLKTAVEKTGGRIDAIYYCPSLNAENAACRKPNIGMAEQARSEFPEIDFSKSIMVGDSPSDIEFGKRAGMLTIGVGAEVRELGEQWVAAMPDMLPLFSA